MKNICSKTNFIFLCLRSIFKHVIIENDREILISQSFSISEKVLTDSFAYDIMVGKLASDRASYYAKLGLMIEETLFQRRPSSLRKYICEA